jgi:hypothetical protein
MEKIIAQDFIENDRDKLEIFINWAKVNDAIIKFQNNSNLSVFQFLFENDGERLWKHFCNDCDRKVQKFLTYLVVDQSNDLLINIYYNKDLYYAA